MEKASHCEARGRCREKTNRRRVRSCPTRGALLPQAHSCAQSATEQAGAVSKAWLSHVMLATRFQILVYHQQEVIHEPIINIISQ